MAFLYRCLFPVFLLFFTPTLLRAEPCPLLLELFTSGKNCANCSYAENAVKTLLSEYSLAQFIPLVYHLDDSLQILASATRGNSFYSISARPTAIVNGISKIPGANASVLNTYRNSVKNSLQRDLGWSIRGWMRMKDNVLVSSVEISSPTPPAQPLDVFCALILNPRHKGDATVSGFVKAASLQSGYLQTETEFRDMKFHDNLQLAAVWFLQNSKSKEIIQARVVTNLSDIQLDLNRDDRINALDLFTFTQWWKTSNTMADINRDSIVDGQDLAQLIGEE